MTSPERIKPVLQNKGTFIIAEAGVNHNGSLDLARQLVEAAAAAGADAVKFQTFVARQVVSNRAPKARYQQKTTGNSTGQLEMLRKLELDQAAHLQLVQHCQANRIKFISTPFDYPSLQLLVNIIGVDLLKISSGEITNAPFLLQIARTQKPVLLSTGMSTLGEIETALSILAFGYISSGQKCSPAEWREAYCSREGRQALQEKVTLLHCTTEYPAPYGEVNLRAMETMRQAFQLPVGLSDHTAGITVAIAAAAREACVIEKHFTLDRNLPGPDHKASLEPSELAQLVKAVRQVELALGSPVKAPAPCEMDNLCVVRKSIVAARPIKKGEVFTEENLSIKRAGGGLPPLMFWGLLGKKALKDYEADERIIY